MTKIFFDSKDFTTTKHVKYEVILFFICTYLYNIYVTYYEACWLNLSC